MLVESGDLVTFDLLTDVYPEEISWMLFSNSTEQVIYSDGPYPESSSYENIHIINEFCLNPGCYTLVVYDSFGDGITGYTQYTDADNGFINLTNTTIDEEYYNFDAGNPTWDSLLLDFCIKSISCPSNLSMGINDSPIELIGGLPVNGTYTGTGVNDNIFDPALAGEGTHTITYHYTFEGSDELTCEFEITVSVNSISNVLNENIEIYPNPTTGILNFDFTDAQDRSIQILDLCGKVVREFNSNSDQLKIDLSELAKGSYFVKIKTENNTTIAKVNLAN